MPRIDDLSRPSQGTQSDHGSRHSKSHPPPTQRAGATQSDYQFQYLDPPVVHSLGSFFVPDSHLKRLPGCRLAGLIRLAQIPLLRSYSMPNEPLLVDSVWLSPIALTHVVQTHRAARLVAFCTRAFSAYGRWVCFLPICPPEPLLLYRRHTGAHVACRRLFSRRGLRRFHRRIGGESTDYGVHHLRHLFRLFLIPSFTHLLDSGL